MPYSYQLIPARSDSNGKPSTWLAGHNPNTIRFTFIADLITPLDIAGTPAGVLAILMAGAPTEYSIGDVIYLTDGINTVYGTVTLITDFGGSYSLTTNIPSSLTLTPPVSIYHGVRAGSYVKFDFLDIVTSVSFATIKRTPQQNGIIDIDLSGSVRGQYSLGYGNYNYQTPNFRNDNAQKHFFLQYTEYPDGTVDMLPDTFHIAKGGFEQRKNNFNSSNFIGFLPNSTPTPGKWLNPFQNAGLNVPIWKNLPFGINFIWPDDVAGLNANTPAGPIVFDSSQANGVNFLTLSEADFDGETEFCFDVGGQPYPSIIKEISGNFRYGGLSSFTYQLAEPMTAVAFEALLGTSLAGTQFYYGTSIPSLTAYPYALWRNKVAAATAGDYIKITNSQNLADAPFIISWGVASILPSFALSLPFDDASVGLDITVPFKYPVALSGTIAGVRAGIRTSAPTSSDWSVFNYDLSIAGGVTAFNAAIALLTGDYVLHFWSNAHTARTANLSYLSATRYRVVHLEEDTNYKYRLSTMSTSLGLSGVGQYVYHPNSISAVPFDNGKTFTCFASFYYQPLRNPTFIFSTTTWKVAIKGLRLEILNNYITIGWQTGGGAMIDQYRATDLLILNGYNEIIIEFTGNPATTKFWVNKKLSNTQVIYNANSPGWSIVRPFDDAETGDYASQAGGGYNYKGRLNRCQFVATTLTTSEREAAFNAGTMQGIIPDASFILDFDYTTTPISARTGTPAFPATEVGAPSKPIYLP